MTFLEFETSANQGSPVEFFQFTDSSGVYRYTSGPRTMDAGGNTWTAISIQRNVLKVPSILEDNVLELTMPPKVGVVADHAYGISLDSLTCVMYRMHLTDPDEEMVEQWRGNVAGIRVKNGVATIRVPSSLTEALKRPVPTMQYQSLCNHKFGDSRCQFTPYTQTTGVDVVTAGGINIQVDDAGDGFTTFGLYVGGTITRVSDGEMRTINYSQFHTVQVLYPFQTLDPGDEVTLQEGCPHTFDACLTRFNNIENFLGFPDIPDYNPFKTGLR